MPKSKVGSVSVVRLQKEVEMNAYSDGDIEDRLLQHFKGAKESNAEFLKKYPGWATTYHLSHARETLLNWFDFKPGSSLLEVGAGLGALTGLFAEKCAEVTALELSERRATANAYRHKNAKNLEVVIGNLDQFGSYTDKKYDYVVCVGVLEYAGRFISDPKPFETFLRKLREHTKPDGTLILAIENKLGLKYWTGAREDHVRRYGEGIENYPHYDGIRTFGKTELTDLVHAAGYKKVSFYYPFPDYKLPHTIFSDSYLPGVHTSDIPSSFYPTPTPDQERTQIVREQLAVRSVAANGLYGELANSFLLFAGSEEIPSNVVFSRSSERRLDAFRVLTSISREKNSFSVKKQALGEPALGHINHIAESSDLLSKVLHNTSVKISPITNQAKNSLTFDYIKNDSMETRLLSALLDKDESAMRQIVADFINIVDCFTVKKLTPTTQKGYKEVFGTAYNEPIDCIAPGILDLNFDNILYDASSFCLIDYEWVFPFAIPRQLIVGRALAYFFLRHSQIMRATVSPNNPAVELGKNLLVPKWLYQEYQQFWDNEQLIQETERAFQLYVTGDENVFELSEKPQLVEVELLDNLPDTHEILQHKLDEQNQQLAVLRKQLDDITNSRSWKAISNAQRIRARFKL